MDVSLSKGAPSLISIGQRVMETGMSFFWMYVCRPCLISHDLMYIIVFEVSNNVPIYGPCCEELKDVFLFTFELKENAFLNRCGVAVDTVGRVYTRLSLDENDLGGLKKENTLVPKNWES